MQTEEEESKSSTPSHQKQFQIPPVYTALEFDANRDYPLHELADPAGGMQLSDPGNLVPDALKALLYKSGK